jgi:hypothetical protein
LAETGSEREIDARTKVRLGRTAVTCGEAEWAVTQIVHFAASLALEWWCATNATAENNVSSRHRNATRFENDRITITGRTSLHKATSKIETNAIGVALLAAVGLHDGLKAVVTRTAR